MTDNTTSDESGLTVDLDPASTNASIEHRLGDPDPDGPQYAGPDDDFDYENQDFSGLSERRVADLYMFGVRFRLSDPATFEDSRALVSAATDPETLCRRALALLVDRPDPIAPVLDALTAYKCSLLAAEALTWARTEDYLDEVDDIEQIRQAAEDAWSVDR